MTPSKVRVVAHQALVVEDVVWVVTVGPPVVVVVVAVTVVAVLDVFVSVVLVVVDVDKR